MVDPHGSLGGPLRVSCNQLSELKEQGHDVLLLATAEGYRGDMPDEYCGIPVKLFPARRLMRESFAGVTSPQLFLWLAKHGRSFDVAHIHMARDLVTLPAARLLQTLRVPTVLQTHGMIDPSSQKLAKPLDAFMTRPAFNSAKKILALTNAETEDLCAVDSRLTSDSVEVVRNGVPMAPVRARPERPSPDVLFLARVQERKRPLVFVEAAQRLAPRHPDATFTLVGPDEGEGDAVRARLRSDDAAGRIRWVGSLPAHQTLDRMAESAVYVLPSRNEPFGMTVLEAMSAGLPVVVIEDCGLAHEVRFSGGGLVAGYGPDELVDVIDRLLDSPEDRRRMGAAGRAFVADHATMERIAQQLAHLYEGVAA
ncbi:glycosyltransferase [Rothia uropygioeca]|uniref:glycosyltransferase n=1 Tax=Kocuria sp. 257 TaxID=2021970 RepID=UPI001EDF60F3|nr:glycosyltransferase [Kocuria sp. 257]